MSYKIIANYCLNEKTQSLGQKRLIGHINSEQIGNKYIYCIQFDRNIDSTQQMTNCCLQSTNESDSNQRFNTDSKDTNVTKLEQQMVNNSNDNQMSDCFNAKQSPEPEVDHNLADNVLKCDEVIDENESNSDSTDDQMNYNCDNKPKLIAINTKSLVVTDSTKYGPQFPCLWPNCGKWFRRKSSLTTHFRIHTGERPFICQYCDKSFNQISALKNHKRIHTGERPYLCDWTDCDHTFKTNAALYQHRKAHETNAIPKPLKQNLKISAKIENKSNNYLNVSNSLLSPKPQMSENNKTIDTSNSLLSFNTSYVTDYQKLKLNSVPKESEVQKNAYECYFCDCNKRFSRMSALINHFNNSHSDQYY